jgi:hypothetical protein
VRRRHPWLSAGHRRCRDGWRGDGHGRRAHGTIRGTLDEHLCRKALRLGNALDLEGDRVNRPSELVVSHLGHERWDLDPVTEGASDGSPRTESGAEPRTDAADEEGDPAGDDEQHRVALAHAVKYRVKDRRPHAGDPRMRW